MPARTNTPTTDNVPTNSVDINTPHSIKFFGFLADWFLSSPVPFSRRLARYSAAVSRIA
jgi:hypothetical protein